MGRTLRGPSRHMTAGDLKVVAALSMVIDHADAALLELALARTHYGVTYVLLRHMVVALHCMGRMSFPLYAFLLVEGYSHTRGRGRYLGRLLACAIISEVPFDLALVLRHSDVARGCLVEFGHQNVLLTLALGLATMWAADVVADAAPGTSGPVRTWRALARILVAACGCGAAWAIRCDYSWYGVAAIVCAREVRRCAPEHPEAEMAAMVPPLLAYGPYEVFALLCCLPVRRYGGERGAPGSRWLFYALYPGHLAALACLRLLLAT